MKIMSLLAGATVAAVITSTTASASRLGDPAAPLVIKDWVKGKAVNVKDGKNIYVVEFWATWCGPCKVSIPHLTEMQQKFKNKGVVFVGISDEDTAKVKPFVEKMGEKMDYIVACDDDRKTNEKYMAAYGQGGIPTAFVVGKDGKVLWVGHPMVELEKTLEQIIAGKYDLQAAIKSAAEADEIRAKEEATGAPLREYSKLSAAADPKARELGRKILADAGTDVDALCNFVLNIVNIRGESRDFVLAEEALTKAEKAAGPKDARVAGYRGIVRFESGKQEEGLKLARQAVEFASGDDKKIYENFVRVMEMRQGQKAGEAKKTATGTKEK